MVYYALFTSPQVFHTKCMYSQCMPRAHLNDLWTNMCRLVSRHGACFWDCRFVHVQRSVKSVRRAKRTYYVERVSRMWVRFHTTQNVRMWYFLKMTMHFVCYARHCCSLVLIVLDADFTALRLHLFSLLSCHRCNNETASATTVLRMITYVSVHEQHLIAFLLCDKLHSWSMKPYPANREHALQD